MFDIVYDAWKDKETGYIVTVVSTCSDHTIKVRGEEGEEIKMTIPEFLEKFEEIQIDIKKYKEQIIEACEIDKDFQGLAKTLMRRLEPGYLTEGATVYFTEPGSYFKKDSNYPEYGAEYPYTISKIIHGNDNNYRYSKYGGNCLWVCLVRKGKKPRDYDNPDFILPIYLDRIVPGDAFWYLRRYDRAF